MAKGNLNSVSCLPILCGLSCVLVCGCDSGPKLRPNWAVIRGTVTYQGKPLSGGYVAFYPANELRTNSSGRIEPDGTFLVQAPIGPAKVTVENSSLKVATPERYVKMPDKYADPIKSGLTYDVKPGENESVRFDLK